MGGMKEQILTYKSFKEAGILSRAEDWDGSEKDRVYWGDRNR